MISGNKCVKIFLVFMPYLTNKCWLIHFYISKSVPGAYKVPKVAKEHETQCYHNPHYSTSFEINCIRHTRMLCNWQAFALRTEEFFYPLKCRTSVEVEYTSFLSWVTARRLPVLLLLRLGVSSLLKRTCFCCFGDGHVLRPP